MMASQGRVAWLTALTVGAAMLGTVTTAPLTIAAGPMTGSALRAERSIGPVATPAGMLSTPPCPPLPAASEFVDRIDNRYLPLQPGTTFTYRETDEDQTSQDIVKVSGDTKLILGVTTTVVRDTVTTDGGELVEKTIDWYAQDRTGNVWYFGEDTAEYEGGKVVSTKGSWQAGVDGAMPGIVMKAHPRPGDTYAQECAPGEAQDTARILNLATAVAVPGSTVDDALLTEDWNPLEPAIVEQKSYAPCVGLVQAVMVKGGSEKAVLVDVKPSATSC